MWMFLLRTAYSLSWSVSQSVGQSVCPPFADIVHPYLFSLFLLFFILLVELADGSFILPGLGVPRVPASGGQAHPIGPAPHPPAPPKRPAPSFFGRIW